MQLTEILKQLSALAHQVEELQYERFAGNDNPQGAERMQATRFQKLTNYLALAEECMERIVTADACSK